MRCRDTTRELAFRWADENLSELSMAQVVEFLYRNRYTEFVRQMVEINKRCTPATEKGREG